MYKFKLRCVIASEILESWRSSKIKESLTTIYQKLPPSSLGLWTLDNCKISFYQEGDCDTTTIKLEEEPEMNEDTKSDDLLEISENILNFEVPPSNHQVPEITETKPANNKSSTNHPVLCLQDIFALTAGNKQSENDLPDNDDDENINDSDDGDDDDRNSIDPDYCEEESTGEKGLLRESNVRRTNSKRPRKKVMQYSKENLKALLTELFSSSEDLKSVTAHESTTIDKDFILSLVDHKMSERRMKILWGLINGKRKIDGDALHNLATLQNVFSVDKYESVFDIIHLNTEEKVRREFQNRKTYKSYIDAKFKCEFCYEGFAHEKRLIYHQRYHDESAGNVVCDICSKRFPHRKPYLKHRLMHKVVFKCKLCPLVTIYRNGMVNHFNQHNGMKYKCPLCDTTFKSKSALNSHCNNHCSAAPNFCTICGRKFVEESILKTHIARDHKDEPPTDPEHCVRCPHCMIGFSTERAMYRHCVTSHGERLWLTRRSSSWKQRGSITLEVRRRRKPVNRKSAICPLCEEAYESRYWLKLHCAEKHPQLDFDSYYSALTPHLCDICGKAFKTKYKLKDHLDLHAGNGPIQCPDCPKRFTYPSQFVYHMSYHRSPELVCSDCGKMFKSESNLINHMRVHKNDRRYKCHICGKGFIHSGSLTEHVRGVHQKNRRVQKKRVNVASKATALVYSGNKSDENALSEHVRKVYKRKRRAQKERTKVASKATELVYSGNESDENALSEHMTGVHQKIRRVQNKRSKVTSKATALVYSSNESDENALSEHVRGVHKKTRRVQKERVNAAVEATELVYSGNESDENILSEHDVRGVHKKTRRVQKENVNAAAEATELVYSGNESDENVSSEHDVRGVQKKTRRVQKKPVSVVAEATELVYSGNESDENVLSEHVTVV